MERRFKLEKIPVDVLLNLLVELYQSGVDFVDLTSDNSDPLQDKLVIFTKEGYINPDHYNEDRLNNLQIEIARDNDDDEDEVEYKLPPIIETKKLSDDDIDKLL